MKNTTKTNSLKVCHILFGVYGVYASPWEYTQKLAASGTDVTVICLNRGDQPDTERVNGVKVIRIKLNESGALKAFRFARGSIYRFISAVASQLKDEKFDIVHLYLFRGVALLKALLPGVSKGWVVDIRSGNIAKNALRSLVGNSLTFLECLAFKHIFVIDNKVGARIFGRSRHFIELPIGVDAQRFGKPEGGSLKSSLVGDDNAIVAVFVSTMSRHRSPSTVIRALALVNQRIGPDRHIKLVMVGGGDELELLKKQAQQEGVQQDVVFSGHVSQEQVASYLSVSDIGVSYIPMTPQYDNQPPLKTLEYMAASLIVVATATTANKKYVTHLENGLLCSDSADSVADALLTCINNSANLEQLSRRAKQMADKHSWHKIVENNLLPVYLKIKLLAD